METEFYICEFCQTEFKPKRRKAQKFCSATCRVKNHHHKNKSKIESVTVPTIEQSKSEVLQNTILPDKTEIEKISPAGVGNAALGTLAADATKALAKHFFSSAENDPATKGDIAQLKSLIKDRYFPVRNLNPNVWGQKPFYDIETGDIVYISAYNPNK